MALLSSQYFVLIFDDFKLKALDSMAQTIGVLESEVAKSKDYLDRVQQHDARNVAGALDLG